MLVEHLFPTKHTLSKSDVAVLKYECAQFLQESNGLPVFRALPRSYNTFQRVKVRQRAVRDTVAEAMNTAFGGHFHNIVARGVFAQSVITETTTQTEPFYVFPVNGYRFAYSKGVQNSNIGFKSVFENLSSDQAFSITTDLIKNTYTTTNLTEGIKSESEIIFYNIPHFYAVRVSQFTEYPFAINR